MVSIGECHLSAEITIWGIVSAIVRISTFPLQIWNLFKKRVQVQIEWSQSENVT